MTKKISPSDPLDDFEVTDDFLDTIAALAEEEVAAPLGEGVADGKGTSPTSSNFVMSALDKVEAAFVASSLSSASVNSVSEETVGSAMADKFSKASEAVGPATEAGIKPARNVTLEPNPFFDEPTDTLAATDDLIEATPKIINESVEYEPEIAAPSGSTNMPVPVGAAGLNFDAQAVEVSIPRIAIHIFAERQDTLAAAERAAQDRRMSRASTQVRVGGSTAAIESYASEPTPPLVVVECMKDAKSLLEEIDRLAEVCDAGTKVIVIGAANDILLYRELMRRGVSEYLVAPIQPLQMIAAIGGLFTDPDQPFMGRTIAFVAARGGAGASSVAHNTAYAMSERVGLNTVIVDYDLPFGTSGLNFNQDPLGGVADALTQPERLDATLLDRMMVRCTDKLSLFAAPATLDTDWDIEAEAYDEVTNRIRSSAPFVVLDLPHVWSAWVKEQLISADEVVIVATPDLASLRNGKNLLDLVRHARPNDAPPRIVLNQVGMPGRPEIPAKEFGQALGIHPCLSIPFDAKTFGAAANNGQMVLDMAAKTKPAEAFETLAQIVTQRQMPTAPARGRKAGGLASLFRKR